MEGFFYEKLFVKCDQNSKKSKCAKKPFNGSLLK